VPHAAADSEAHAEAPDVRNPADGAARGLPGPRAVVSAARLLVPQA
jgi:hypothetical protein